MLPWQWILMAAVAAALVILGVLVLAAVAASRSRPRPGRESRPSGALRRSVRTTSPPRSGIAALAAFPGAIACSFARRPEAIFLTTFSSF